MKKRARRQSPPDPVLRVQAAAQFLRGQPEQDKALELAAFMAIFHGRTLTAAEAADILRK